MMRIKRMDGYWRFRIDVALELVHKKDREQEHVISGQRKREREKRWQKE